jgi:hypothetical protein
MIKLEWECAEQTVLSFEQDMEQLTQMIDDENFEQE